MLRSLSSRRPRLSYANVTATVALFIALGGSAYALGRNSVGSRELDKNAVQKRHVERNAIAANEIKRRGVKAQKIAPNAVRPAKIPDGSLTGQKIDESTLGVVPSARSAGDAERLGGLAAAQYQERVFAVIDAESGGLLRGTNAVSAERLPDRNGFARYRVRFNRDVSGCARIASAELSAEAEPDQLVAVNTVESPILINDPFYPVRTPAPVVPGTTFHLEVIC